MEEQKNRIHEFVNVPFLISTEGHIHEGEKGKRMEEIKIGKDERREQGMRERGGRGRKEGFKERSDGRKERRKVKY